MGPEEMKRGIIQRTREARARAGLIQEEVAKYLGIKQDTYKNYETIRPLPVELIPDFCALCDIPTADLFPAVVKKREKRSTAA